MCRNQVGIGRFRATEPYSSTELCSYKPESAKSRTLFVLPTYPVYRDINVFDNGQGVRTGVQR